MDLNTFHFSGDVAVAQDERKKKEVKDNRNLYLAREGAIREGTKVFIQLKEKLLGRELIEFLTLFDWTGLNWIEFLFKFDLSAKR